MDSTTFAALVASAADYFYMMLRAAVLAGLGIAVRRDAAWPR